MPIFAISGIRKTLSVKDNRIINTTCNYKLGFVCG